MYTSILKFEFVHEITHLLNFTQIHTHTQRNLWDNFQASTRKYSLCLARQTKYRTIANSAQSFLLYIQWTRSYKIYFRSGSVLTVVNMCVYDTVTVAAACDVFVVY